MQVLLTILYMSFALVLMKWVNVEESRAEPHPKDLARGPTGRAKHGPAFPPINRWYGAMVRRCSDWPPSVRTQHRIARVIGWTLLLTIGLSPPLPIWVYGVALVLMVAAIYMRLRRTRNRSSKPTGAPPAG